MGFPIRVSVALKKAGGRQVSQLPCLSAAADAYSCLIVLELTSAQGSQIPRPILLYTALTYVRQHVYRVCKRRCRPSAMCVKAIEG